jgi:hypothetical protein
MRRALRRWVKKGRFMGVERILKVIIPVLPGYV